MMPHDEELERRPARRAADARLGCAVADAVRELAMLYPDVRICTRYDEVPAVAIVRAVGSGGVTLAERWVVKQ